MTVVRRDDRGRRLETANVMHCTAGMLVLDQRAADTLADVWAACGELLPMTSDIGPLWAFNAVGTTDAFDEDASEVFRFDDGRVLDVIEHVFHEDRVRSAPPVFRIPQAPGWLYCTDEIVARVRQAGLTGLSFQRLWTGGRQA